MSRVILDVQLYDRLLPLSPASPARHAPTFRRPVPPEHRELYFNPSEAGHRRFLEAVAQSPALSCAFFGPKNQHLGSNDYPLPARLSGQLRNVLDDAARYPLDERLFRSLYERVDRDYPILHM
jgi:hypothetical protein